MVQIEQIDFTSALGNRYIVQSVLSQEAPASFVRKFCGNASCGSYIAASYVKFVEGGGARVVPIRISQTRDYYRAVMRQINGVLLPGGGADDFDRPGGYGEAGAHIYEVAKEMNRQGDYFPLWGTCLGMELLAHVSAGRRELRADCWASNLAMPLNLCPDFFRSQLFGAIPDDILTILSSDPVNAHFHHYCVTEKNMTEYGILHKWHILAMNHDVEGMEFVSVIESRKYPFYGIIFHPEKNAYEWATERDNPHSADAIKAMQYFSNFFVNEARKSNHSFQSRATERNSLIYNYKIRHTGTASVFEQVYFL
ncbi:gamma-glutamyl hydrolase B-like [Schistocerca gregaria]|uniref:gamma-glutamyl hydrolase B-like n=1 Tax=Schistocerca gregaria TaxID=7010 RepID=UPI00211E85F4|nr:gamma-glutamyl hydrolase B-like [Schistocerca gregaria]